MNPSFAVTSLIYALLCAMPAMMKLRGTAKMRSAAEHFGIPWTRFRIIGYLEAAAATGVLLGIYWRPVGLAAALGMTALLVGALIFHRRAHDKFGEFISGLVFLVASAGYLGIWFTS